MPPPPKLPIAAQPTSTTIAEVTGDEPEPSGEPSAPPSVMLEPIVTGAPPVPNHFPELDSPSEPALVPAHVPYLDPATAALYEPAGPEDFAARRRRFQRQETAIFGRMPNPLRSENRTEPYEKPPKTDEDANFSQAFAVQDDRDRSAAQGMDF
jgi:type IV secretory pathway VirB10-like protein